MEIAAAADDGLTWAMAAVVQARKIVNYLDPVGVGARDLKECLLIQICAQQRRGGDCPGPAEEEDVEQWSGWLRGF